MAGLDTSIALGIKPVDFGDPNEGRMNALRAQLAQQQIQQGQFNMMKAQRDMEYQNQQRAAAAAAVARDKAAEAQALKLYGQTGAPGYQAYSPSMEPGAASDVGMLGGGQGYTEGAVNRLAMPAQPKNFDDAITTALQSGKIDPTVVRKLMALKEAQNVYAKSNLGVDEATLKNKKGEIELAKADLERGAKAIEFHASALPTVTPETWGAWRSNAVKDLPGLDQILPQTAPADPVAFDQLKRSLILKAQDSVKQHYQSVTRGNETGVVAIDPVKLTATNIAGAEGTPKPTKETKPKLQQLQDYKDEIAAELEKDPYNTGLKQKLAEVQDNINKEAKVPGDPNAAIPPNSKLFIEATQKHEKDLKGVSGSIQKVDSAVKKIDQILDPKFEKAFDNLFGGYGAYVTQRFTGDTATIKAKFDSLKSDMKAVGLDIIRAKGGVGAMTVQEWPIVQDMIDKLDPTMPAPAARAAMEGIRAKFENMVENDKQVYDATWGQTQFHKKDYGYVPMGGKAGASAPSGGPSVDDLVNQYKSKK
jgi:hypothetical protein